MKKFIASLVSLATALSVFAFAAPAQAIAGVTVGNSVINRAVVDTYSNFTIIDTNNPVSANGWLSSFSFYTVNKNPFEFVLVDGGNVVKWISAKITPATTGLQTYGTVVPVQAGWNLGVHFDSTGTIPFDYVGSPAPYTPNNNGMPVVGATLSIEGSSGRTYSWYASGTLAATCSTINLVSGTGTQTAGYTETTQAGPSTALLASSYSGSGSYTPAFATQTVIPPWIDPTVDVNFASTGALWISTNATWPGGAGNTEGLPGNDQWRLFKDSFTLPAGAVVTSANLAYTADNAADVYLNGNVSPISSTGNTYGPSVASPLNFETVFTTPLTPAAGANTLNFVVRNWGGDYASNPTGLLYKAVVNYCVPNAAPVLDCPAAPSIAAAYLQLLGVKPGSTAFKNIISLVAQNMGPQTDFNGIHACQTGYDTVVKAFVDANKAVSK